MINILIAEDNRTTYTILKNYINKYFLTEEDVDFTVDIAHNGQIALDMVQKKTYDILFLDIVMPKVDGFEFLDFLKSYDIKYPYICVTTALWEDNYEDILTKKGASSWVIKPYNKKTIFIELDKFFKNK